MKANKTRFGASLREGWEFHRTFHLEVKRAIERVHTWGKCVYISLLYLRLASRSPQSLAGSSVDLWVSEGGGGARLIRECGKQPETRIVQLLGRERLYVFSSVFFGLFQVPWSSGLFWLCCRAVIVLPRLSGTGGQHQKTWRSRHWSEHSKILVCRLCTEKKFFFIVIIII